MPPSSLIILLILLSSSGTITPITQIMHLSSGSNWLISYNFVAAQLCEESSSQNTSQTPQVSRIWSYQRDVAVDSTIYLKT